MAEHIDFANAQDGAAAHLHTETGRPAGDTAPNPRPPEFIEVLVTGGSRPNLVTEAVMLTITCDAPTKDAAYRLANEARSAMTRLRTLDGHHVYHVEELGGPAWSPDPDTEKPRYEFTVRPHLRLTTKAP
ncbi:hypothetical protein H490_0103910 [Leucobacter sp. UCD-THU]|uniref:hypothetical protein n=1 Tax=Leucobacter sp. UCD-THU TaxID=1292023 RepID=UPI000362766F|nr:hypothetical protein [Leucobacter sp. UCD-THU]EYT56029.1 hypothetical protein H490_0103910 [Leucobacter sp. UCD-THU]